MTPSAAFSAGGQVLQSHTDSGGALCSGRQQQAPQGQPTLAHSRRGHRAGEHSLADLQELHHACCLQCCHGCLHARGGLFQVKPPFLQPWGNIHYPGLQTSLSKEKGCTGRGDAERCRDAKDLADKHPHCTQLDWPARDNPRSCSSWPWPSALSLLQGHLRQAGKQTRPSLPMSQALPHSQSSVPGSPGL